MKTYKVKDIVELAHKKYDLYGLDLDDQIAKTKLDTYQKHVRTYLKKKYGYPKFNPETKTSGYNNIDKETANYIVDHLLKDYFLQNSNSISLQRNMQIAEKLNQLGLQQHKGEVERFQKNIPIPVESPAEDEHAYMKEKDDFISSLEKNEFDSTYIDEARIKYPHLRQRLTGLEDALEKAKVNYIFDKIMKDNNKLFDQKEFIKDFFESSEQIDISDGYEQINNEYVKLNKKLSSISSYIKDRK